MIKNKNDIDNIEIACKLTEFAMNDLIVHIEDLINLSREEKHENIA